MCFQKVVFTDDGLRPYTIRLINPSTRLPELYPLVWGVTWSFTLQWPSVPGSFTHRFTVTEYWDENLYIYEHTFYENTNALTSKPAGDIAMPNGMLQDGVLPVSLTIETQSIDPMLLIENHITGVHNGGKTVKDSEKANKHTPDSVNSQCTSEGTCDQDIANSVQPPILNPYLESQQTIPDTKDKGEEYLSDRSLSLDKSPGTCTRDTCDESTGQGDSLLVELRTFSMLTFNIWNTNEVEGSKQAYTSRIAHIGQVRRPIICIHSTHKSCFAISYIE